MKLATNMLMAAAIAATLLGCGPKVSGPVVAIEDKIYAVTPAELTVRAGLVSGEVTEMKVIERVEKISGKVDTPARLSAKIKLKNTSADQTVRLIGGKLRYIDTAGNTIKIEEARTEPVIRFTSSSAVQLDPGQDTTQSIEVDFPAVALEAKKLKEIRFELTYVPTAFKQESANLSVVISAGAVKAN
jgi:hypothetical protein